MTDINKQKFLAELGKLLTFMYEEDRQLALAMYGEIFDQAEDQQALMNHLVSPTRQAVVIARAYNAKERKLQIHSQSRDDGDIFESDYEDAPAFIQAITANLPFDFEHVEEDTVSADQFSLFENGEHPVIDDDEADKAEEEAAPADSVEAAPAEAVPAEAEIPAEEEDESEKAAVSDADEEAPAEELSEDIVTADVDGEQSDAGGADNAEAEDSADEEPDAASSETSEYEELSEEDDSQADEVQTELSAQPAEKVLKPRIGILLIYVLLAVPITVAGIAVLLIPTVLFLLLAAGVIYAGSVLLVGAFSGFAVFADIMVVLGTATVTLALGLLFFWIFIWFIGGAMAALIRLALELGRKWCYKEVPAV